MQHRRALLLIHSHSNHLRKMNVYGQKCLTSNYRCHCVIMLLCTVAWTCLHGQGRYLSIVIFVNTMTIAKMRGWGHTFMTFLHKIPCFLASLASLVTLGPSDLGRGGSVSFFVYIAIVYIMPTMRGNMYHFKFTLVMYISCQQ